MKFKTREDIEAPMDFVYRALSDTDHWERTALRRGATVERQDTNPIPGAGMQWAIGFDFRGKRRNVVLRCTEMDGAQRMAFEGTGKMLAGQLDLDLTDMGPKRTRLTVAVDVKPLTIAARLFLQTLALARGRVQARFDKRAAQLAADIEDRYRKSLRR
jgi:carbon monoxide dehydrogenase subunit G